MTEPADRAERIGKWVSGLGHAGLLGWAAVGGALFGPQPSPPIQMTQVATMTEAEFQDFAAASRGAGPVQGNQQDVAALPEPVSEDVQSGALEASRSPEPEAEAQPLPEPDTAEPAPDLTDLTAPELPVSVATALPQPELSAPPEQAPAVPDDLQSAIPPQAETAPLQPEAPESPAQPDAVIQPPALPEPPAPPRSELTLDNSPRPLGRPDGLVENRNRRLAEQAAEAEAEARRQEQARADAAAEAQRQAEEAAAEARARAEAEAARAAAEAALREAEEAQRQADAEAAAQAEADRLQREEEERLAAAAEQQRLEDEQRRAEEAAQAERDRIAAEVAAEVAAEAAAQQAASEPAEPDTLPGPVEPVAEQDALMAALAEALGTDQAAPVGDAPAGDETGGVPDGPPLSLSEREGFRLAIDRCWRVGTLSREAHATSVSVAFSMSPDGLPEPGTMRLIGYSGGTPAAAQQAYEAAERAIVGCAGTGYALPPEKYNRWKEVIIDFHPDGVGVQ